MVNLIRILLRLLSGLAAAPRRRFPVSLSAAALMLAAQFALGVHQFQHYLNLDADAENHCVLCQVAAGQDTGPVPQSIPVPTETVADTQYVIPQESTYYRALSPAGFRSRAPPTAFF